ncbi:metallophosphoesterase [Aequorivita echinoideorum]|uniref:Metallophosphoesterase n=1 Tax=Aequorivita echinoideorum TaxID=1549647 RepID=A0ABS5S9P9_9FLAO|nr:metallophosphoesterase [Aequorivita echinoideorum]MBT0609165.1 metallophosphoesterase [Aequorivita echinoideorum]
MIFKRKYFYFILTIALTSCATYAPQYKFPDANPIYPSEKTVEKTFYLVGDAGLSPMGGMSEALQTFKNYLSKEKVNDNYTIYLGDNIYPSGLEPEGDPKRKMSENMIDAQYKAVKDYTGQTVFIPGNHEYYSGGVVGLKREEDYVEKLFGGEDAFRPSNGCPLESVNVSDDIQLIVIDSQWYLEDWNKNPTMNKDCDIKSREKFFIELNLEIQKNKNKTIVFAMHHPMYTDGNHGGYFALEKHLYPLQKKIPMPFLASIVVQVRSQGGVSVQDRYNELYNNLMNRLQQIVKNHKRVVFVSGHDHTLQYIEDGNFRQIVSGSGSKESYAATGENGYFSNGRQGFAVLDVFTDGSSWVRYYAGDENFEPEIIFQKEVIPAPVNVDLNQFQEEFPSEVSVPIYKQDSIREALFFKTIWGQKYENAYSTSVRANVAVLDTLYGGLTVIREGKELDYRSLVLRDKKGNRYRMRAMGKNALQISEKLVFDANNENPAQVEKQEVPKPEILNVDFYTASHPYAVMAIPYMAKAINVFYTTPELFYVPKQKRLGNYNDNFGDELYLISVEPSERSEGEVLFEYPDDVETTDDILIKLRKTGNVFVDEQSYIKSRLFDMLIGDWDRENDHWRWAQYDNNTGEDVYVPIAKNRDEAFSSFEGNILDITRSIFGGTRQSHVYSKNLTDLKWFNQEGTILDRALIQNSGRNQWKFLATVIQDSITDSIIDNAFEKIPQEVQDESLQNIKKILKERKKNLVDIADRYYTYLSTLQTIVGTDYDDIFEITRLPDGKTNIKTYTTINGVKSDTLIDRTFSHKDTKELWLYGLNGNDSFRIVGDHNDLIYVRAVGGHGTDSYDLEEGRRVKVYDYQNLESTVVEKKGGSLRFTDVYNLNTYDYRKQIDRTHGVVSAIGYNPDDGFRAAAQYIFRIDNFQKNPFSQRHTLNAAYFTDVDSYELAYTGEFANIKDDLNLSLGGRYTSPNYTINFFGFGNETENLQEEAGFDFNRIKVQNISANVGLLRNSLFGSFFKLQTSFETYRVDDSGTNFFNLIGNQTTDNKYFGTLEGIYNYRSADDVINPTLGMMFDLQLGVTDNLEDNSRVFGFLKSRIGFYNTLIRDRSLVLKTNLRTHLNFGNQYEFYQAAFIGGDSDLRGYRAERFMGRSALVGSADLRYKFPSFKIGIIPINIGIYGGADLGRVWQRNETSKKWHNSRGGGLYINGSGGLNGSFSAFNSTEGTRVTFGLGFDF